MSAYTASTGRNRARVILGKLRRSQRGEIALSEEKREELQKKYDVLAAEYNQAYPDQPPLPDRQDLDL